MTGTSRRSPALIRGSVIIVGSMLAAGALGPAFGAAAPTKANVKRSAAKLIEKKGAPLFIQEGELARYGPIRLSAGASAALPRVGPFTFTAVCDDVDANNDGAPLEEQGLVMVETGENDSLIDADLAQDPDFDQNEVHVWSRVTASTPGAQIPASEDQLRAVGTAPGGTRFAAGSLIALNHAGVDCTFWGFNMVLP